MKKIIKKIEFKIFKKLFADHVYLIFETFRWKECHQKIYKKKNKIKFEKIHALNQNPTGVALFVIIFFLEKYN